jgi:hypothetical protein
MSVFLARRMSHRKTRTILYLVMCLSVVLALSSGD